MVIQEKSTVGDKALRNKEAVLIGLSIKNSYFKDENIKELLEWAKENFEHVNIMCPDEPAIHTLKSLGHDDKKATEKAMLECNRLANKCKRYIEELGIANRARIVRWDELGKNDSYKKTFQTIKELYEKDQDFRNDARATTQQVIEQHGTSLPIEEAIDIGVEFFLKELALIINSAEILGVSMSAYVYHRKMPVLEKMLNGGYKYTPPQNTGYVICETDHSLANVAK